nr:AAA family ATPase [Marinomonas sp. 15G1-11]
MKIKQVKIQAFKSYLEEKDGIFDFSHGNENDVANIVSIYAPNGFGKTSFYDAVDFCITNNVTRYIRDDKVQKKNDKLSKKHPNILRNSKAPSGLDTKVDVVTSDNQVFNKVLKHKNGNQRDYLFRDSDTPENKKYFRDLMLSQEAIDAFLRETDPATRYEKFAENHVNELSELNNKRKQIQKILDDINTSVKTDNKTKQDKNIASLIVNVDEAILTKLDALISECDKLDLNITAIQNSFDEAKYKLLKLEIRSLLDTLAQDTIKKNLLKNAYLDFTCNVEFVKSTIDRIHNAKKSIHLFRIKQQVTVQKDDFTKLEFNLSTLGKRYEQLSEICNDDNSFYKTLSDKNDLLANNKKFKKDIELKENEKNCLQYKLRKARNYFIRQNLNAIHFLKKKKIVNLFLLKKRN